MASIASVLTSVQYPNMQLCSVTGYAAHKDKALKNGWAHTMGEKVYLQRYFISWGVNFKNNSGSVAIYLRFQLHKGQNDEFLKWPFSNKLKLSVIHPETREERHICAMPDLSQDYVRYYCKPVEDSSGTVYFPNAKLELSYPERDGYVQTDQLSLKMEVL